MSAVPLDARFSLSDRDFSYLLQDWSQALCVPRSFEETGGACAAEEARQTVERILGIGQSVCCLKRRNPARSHAITSACDTDCPSATGLSRAPAAIWSRIA
ncbi:MAG: hypothetical protein NTW86_02540 [Candidatus Sumerlaeota bacterium]|nr:hypothetical protein [Candidatus Sumerlaeota bacterium]